MKLQEKIKWWLHYHFHSLKGQFELLHFFQWLLCMAVCIFLMELVIYVWVSG